MQFHEKLFFDLLDFMSFFAWTFSNFLARCAFVGTRYLMMLVGPQNNHNNFQFILPLKKVERMRMSYPDTKKRQDRHF